MLSKRTFSSLPAKIITWFFIPAAIILSIVAMFIFVSYNRVVAELTAERNQELTRLMAGQVESSLQSNIGLLFELAQAAVFFEEDQAAYQDLITAYQPRIHHFDGGLLMINTFGRVLATDPSLASQVGIDHANTSYYQALISSLIDSPSEPFISDIVRDDQLNPGAVALAVPIQNERREFLGAVVAFYQLGGDPLSELLPDASNAEAQKESEIFLIDGEDRIVAHSNPAAIGDSYGLPEAAKRIEVGSRQNIFAPSFNVEDTAMNLSAIDGTNWTLVVENPFPELVLSNRRDQALILLLLGLGIIFPVLIVTIGVRKVMQPIRALIVASQAVAAGNFEFSIDAKGEDEIQELAAQFNLMSVQLRESYSNLELTLSRRTSELATLNAIAASVSSSLDLAEILDLALINTLEIMDTEAGGVYLLENEQPELQLTSYRGFDEDTAAQIDNLAIGEGFSGEVVRSRQALVVDDLSIDPRLTRQIVKRIGFRSLVSVPLVSRRQVLGTLFVLSKELRKFSAQEIELLTSIGHQLGAAVDSAQLFEQSQKAAVLEERQRLARDLHDAVTQTLFSASLIAEVLPRIWEKDPEEGSTRAQELRELTRGALAEMRSLLVELRPAALVDAELPDLLKQLADATRGKARIPVTINLEGTCDLPIEVKVAMYYIAQEALNNVAKHADATKVEIQFSCQGGHQANLQIIDDGQGFDASDVSPGEFGLGIMEERANAVGASFAVRSEHGKGTRIITRWTNRA